jgi:ComEC/Rec2-related protein
MSEGTGAQALFQVRAPLFGVALAFLSGTAAGLFCSSSLWFWLALGSFTVWWMVRKTVWIWWLALAVGAYWAQVNDRPTVPWEVRQLPAQKFLPETEWRGHVAEFPEANTVTGQNLTLELNAWRPPGSSQWADATGRVKLRHHQTAETHWGEIVEARGGLSSFPEPTNPGQFDARAYAQSHGVWFRLEAVECRTISAAPWIYQRLEAARAWAKATLALGIEDDEQAAGLLAGMILGSKEDIPADLQTAFRRTGTFHIFAVSGQNVAMLLAVVVLALQVVGLTRWRWSWLSVPLLLAYCLITGAQASAVRALVMAVAVLLAWRMSRPTQALNLWSMAVIGSLAFRPGALRDLGWELSFAVVLALVLLGPPLFRLLFKPVELDPWIPPRLISESRRRLDGILRHVVMLLSASLAAWMGSLPWSGLVFHQISWVALVANLLVVPLAGLIGMVGPVSLAVSLLSPAIAATLNNTNWLLLRVLVSGTVWLSHWPGAATPLASWEAACPADAVDVWFFDYTRVPLAVIRTPSGDWMVNAGQARDFPYAMEASARWLGVQQARGIVVTQLSGLHAGAAPAAQQAWSPARWIVPPGKTHAPFLREWITWMDAASVPKDYWWQGRGETWDRLASVECLWPPPEANPIRSEDRGLVFRFNFCGHRMLWAGAVSDDVEREILARSTDVQADILVQHEHSIAQNMTPDWLRAVKPAHWIHPRRNFSQQRMNQNPLLNLKSAERPVDWNLARTGAVRARFTAQGVSVQPWREASIHEENSETSEP